jgi:hypothetical protein
MIQKFDSMSEAQAAPGIAQLGGHPCSSFAPHLSANYQDADGRTQVGKPDYRIDRPRCFTLLDTKDGKLNNHYSFASSHAALKDAYRYHFHRCGDHLTHSELSRALYAGNGYAVRDMLEAAFNHSVWKLAALQAQHGWQRFVVVFKTAPTKSDARRYLDAGLIFCTVKTLWDLMNTIELLQHGWHVPFVFKGRGYSFTVAGDPRSKSLSATAIEEADRAKFLAAVDADKATAAAIRTKQDADEAAGIPAF